MSERTGNVTRNTFADRCNQITGSVIDTALDVHRRLGPGLLESVYCEVLAYELRNRGLSVEVEVPVPVVWESVRLDVGFRVDLLLERTVIVEIKSVESVARVHKKQPLTYLRLADCLVGLRVNFGAELLRQRIHRVVNGLDEHNDAPVQHIS